MIPLSSADLMARIASGKSMWIVSENGKFAKLIIGFNDVYCTVVSGINYSPKCVRFRLDELSNYHFADGTPFHN